MEPTNSNMAAATKYWEDISAKTKEKEENVALTRAEIKEKEKRMAKNRAKAVEKETEIAVNEARSQHE